MTVSYLLAYERGRAKATHEEGLGCGKVGGGWTPL